MDFLSDEQKRRFEDLTLERKWPKRYWQTIEDAGELERRGGRLNYVEMAVNRHIEQVARHLNLLRTINPFYGWRKE